MDPITRTKGSYTISDDPGRLDLRAMHSYLRRAYWSEGIPFEVVERSARASLCIGTYDAVGAQVGLARFISDYATFCYVCDVYVLEEHRGRGLSKAMMALGMDHPRLQGIAPLEPGDGRRPRPVPAVWFHLGRTTGALHGAPGS